MFGAIKDQVGALVDRELFFASQKHPPFRSPHEGAAVIREELEEAQEAINAAAGMYQALWIKVKHDESTGKIAELLRVRAEAAACECIQLAAMAQKFIDSEVKR